MARDQYVSLVVVHALPPNGLHPSNLNGDPQLETSGDMEVCRKQFSRMRAMAPDIPITFRVVRGHSVNAILHVALEEKAGLIVIASHRHSQFHLQLHGSVAEGVLRQTHCPVVVLRQPTGSYLQHPKQCATHQTS
jgi:nucleotide-binding universal stress UspA family protein